MEISARHQSFGIRQAAVDALARVAPERPPVKAALLAALHDESPFVRREALQALIVIPALEPADILTIRELERDPHEDVSRWSEIALRNIRAKRADA